MLKRRTESEIEPQQLFDDALYSAFQWPGKTTRLERDSFVDYRQRISATNFSVAELYHENSKLFAAMSPQLTAGRLDVSAFREQFLRRRAAAVRASTALSLSAAPSLQSLLSAAARAADPQLFYAVELRLIADGQLALHEPATDVAQWLKKISTAELDTLRRAIRLLNAPDGELSHPWWLFVVGCFARNDLLFGSRGYRSTLLAAGQVTQALLREATRLAMTTRVHETFADRAVDGIIEVDGVEEGTLLIIEVEGAGHVQ